MQIRVGVEKIAVVFLLRSAFDKSRGRRHSWSVVEVRKKSQAKCWYILTIFRRHDSDRDDELGSLNLLRL